jgi:hypothetical protein
MVNNHLTQRALTMKTRHLTTRSKLDKAIFASVAAMLAMNLFVLAQQLQPAPALVAAGAVAAQQA